MATRGWMGVWSALCLGSIAASGCDGGAEQPATANNESLATVAPDSFTTASGRVYRKVKKAVIASGAPEAAVQAAQETTGPNGERVLSYPPASTEDLKTLPVEQLAARLRGRALRDGYEYEEAELPMELAAKVMSDWATGKAAPATSGSRPQAAAPAAAAPDAPADGAQRYIIGTDNRVYAGGDRGWPNSTQLYSNGNGCSATMIGSRVAASAAHCVYNNGTWSTPASLIPAADTGGNPQPYGQFFWSTIMVPGGWTGSQWDLDYAVIEFGTRVGDTTGWIGTIDTSSGTMQMVGYPGDKPVPQMWAKAGSVTSTSSGRRKHDLDIIPGDSGAGLYTQSGVQLVGIQSTQNWSQTCFAWICGSKSYWNEATRWSSTTYNFFQSSGLWPD